MADNTKNNNGNTDTTTEETYTSIPDDIRKMGDLQVAIEIVRLKRQAKLDSKEVDLEAEDESIDSDAVEVTLEGLMDAARAAQGPEELGAALQAIQDFSSKSLLKATKNGRARDSKKNWPMRLQQADWAFSNRIWNSLPLPNSPKDIKAETDTDKAAKMVAENKAAKESRKSLLAKYMELANQFVDLETPVTK